LWIDLIKVVAAFAVVVSHSAGPILNEIGKIDITYWQYGNIYGAAVRMCVPLFFMISGALLLNSKEEPLKVFFKKRFTKVIIPLIAWTFIYILLRKFFGHQDINIFKQMLAGLVTEQYYHLWFLYTIIGLYLFVPFLKIIINHSSHAVQVYFVVLWFIAVAIIPLLNKFSGYTIPNHMPMMTGHVGYFVLGYLLSKMQISKQTLLIAIVLAFTSTLITIEGTDYLSHNQGKLDDWFYGFTSITTIVQGISYFLIIKYIGENAWQEYSKLKNIIFIFSNTSLGIYLIHPIMMEMLKKIGLYDEWR
jgi:surface polysaccharide O-acyltransferase-like enzyme